MNESKDYIDEIRVEDVQDVSLSKIYRTKPRRVKVKVKVAAKRVSQRKSKCTCRLKYYNPASLSTGSKEQDFIPSIPFHLIFVFLDPILIGVLQIEFQNKKESPFDTNPLQMHIFLTAICIYAALLGIKIHPKIHGGYLEEILNYGLLLSGVLSSVSLLSILLQQQLLHIVLIIWGSIPIILAHGLLKSSACWIIQMLTKFTRRVKHSSASESHSICPRV